MYVYVIANNENRLYVGMSECPEKRLQEHNSGKTKSTKGYMPWKIIYIQECKNRAEARVVEKYWKSGNGREKLKATIR
ncbi:MAG: GIY-YIG nuclease family protein [bacterium]